MKSFDHRLQEDLFPATPNAFHQLVKRSLATACASFETAQNAVVRSSAVENEKKTRRKPASIFTRIGTVAAAAILVIGTVAVGMVAVLATNEKTTPGASDHEQPTATTAADLTNIVVVEPVETQPAVTDAPKTTNTVHAATVEEFLAAIAPHTEIVLSGGTYDLSMAAQNDTGDNPYASFVQSDYWVDSERFLKIAGVDDLCIRTQEGEKCVFTAKQCEAVFAAESCSELTVSGITFCGDETGISLRSCSNARVEHCAFETEWASDVHRCENITLSDFMLTGSIITLYESKGVTVSNADLSNFGFTTSFCTDILVSECQIHDLQDNWDIESLSEEEPGDASYLISLYDRSGSGSTIEFRNCAFYNNKCTNLFSADGVDHIILAGLNIHDNFVDKLFSLDATESAGSHVIVNCDIVRNNMREFLHCGQSETKVDLSGTSIEENAVKTVFSGGDITVSGCAFANSEVTHWLEGGTEDDPDRLVSVHDPAGNELGGTELAAMTLQRSER